jgi:hypothetical protein
MTQPGSVEQQTRWTAEVLRRAGAVLNGRMVGVWEVAGSGNLVPLAANAAEAQAWEVTPEVGTALKHMAMPSPPGSRWVAGLLPDGGRWCVAPVRDRVPDPPPGAQERRSRERLALELAGLCLGLSRQVGNGGPVEPDLFERFMAQLGSFSQDIAGPLAVARAAVVRSSTALGEAAPADAAGRERVLEDLRAAARALEQAVTLVRTVHERARAVLAHGGEFDVVQVIWSCVDGERAQAALRGATLELKTLAYVVSVLGSAESLRNAVSALIRSAVQGMQGRTGTVAMALENVGPVVRLVVRVPGASLAEAGAVAGVKRIVETEFGGTLALTTDPATGTELTVALPVPSHRFRDPALWWER